MELYIQNLKYLRDKLNLKNKGLAKLLFLSENNLHAILSGHKTLTNQHKIDICNIFGIPLDVFEHKDFSKFYKDVPIFEMLGMTGVEFISAFFDEFHNWIIFLDDENVKDEKYLKYINALRNPENFLSITPEEWNARNVVDTCFDCYVKTKSPKVCINTLLMILTFWINLREPIADLDDTLINNAKKSAFKDPEKKRIEEDNFTDYFYFMAMDLLKELYKNEEYRDFIPYFLALKTTFNFIHKPWREFSDEEARSIGLAMLTELDEIGNKYAKTFVL